ncbi:EAL domain, c-di-GMP-specific phosphodiesterase class I (or its enzymatically inactive variant) [Noviherbaspirillum humi]|uniref:EAL domain, c-di-GMP-specific phosphodiesterase class I (Or its enzymatically inactive variant) n=1 Tax=Noviherbaspirillum humi TaxID=1688639 RepID=A0A239HQD4_9BURK|nr:EAL domain-containing protein [Noviherbaspirillum humi]SNS83490.1 EAL domain, c-di-GMP-specific phosphodiesterase class I (or its enzymatically inactive variant) [Noviherbaspirillum humi]
MSYAVLDDYIRRLPRAPGKGSRLWLNAKGQAEAKYFNCTLTSVFQPLRRLSDGAVAGHEAFVRSAADGEPALSVWKILELAANDDESVELDRLCRMLHAVNFFRQPESGEGDLFLSVHDRLLAAVGSNHGMAFRRILGSLGLPVDRIVLQLPAPAPSGKWLLNHVAGNYLLNGFRIAVNVTDINQAMEVLEDARPALLKLDVRAIADERQLMALLSACRVHGVRLVLRRIDSQPLADLARSLQAAGPDLLLQGLACDRPAAGLAPAWREKPGAAAPPPCPASHVDSASDTSIFS